MHCAVRKEFRRHVIEMVTRLQVDPVAHQLLIIAASHPVRHTVELVDSSSLEFITHPGGEVSFLIGPRDG